MSFALGQPASKTELETRLAALEAAMVGPVFLSGSGDPAAGLGVDGDHYLNNDNGRFFQKVSGAWALLGEIWLDKSGA